MGRAALLLTALVAALAGCASGGGHGHGETAAPPPSPTGPIDARFEAQAGTAESELSFAPAVLRIPAGQNVEIVVRNDGATPHTFTVHGYGLDSGRLLPGESRTFAFLAERDGSFEIMCDEPGHYDSGMKATLEVAR